MNDPGPLAEPRRIAFAADWHANTSWAVSAVHHAKDQDADVILHLGDFGYRFTAAFRRELTNALNHTGLHLLFVDGNHDDHSWLLRRPVGANGLRQVTDTIWHLPRGFRWTWAGVRFLALGGAHSVDRPWRTPGASWWPEETITPQQASRTIERGPADLLVAHDCPAGVNIPGLSPDQFPPEEIRAADQHRQLLRTVVDAVQPKAIWHGHYHQRYDARPDFGYGPVHVRGLDCDGTTLDRNVQVVDIADLPQVQTTAHP